MGQASHSTVAFYVSGHGYGHAVRAGLAAEELLRREPRAVVHVRSRAPAWIFPSVPGRLSVHEVATDVGLVQPHGLEIDLAATLAALDAFEESWERRLDTEVRWLRDVSASLVLGDIPPLAFAAASAAGVPSVALANFSWDWIYRHYGPLDARFEVHAERARRRYALAEELWRLPFHGDLGAFQRIRDLPLVVRHSPLEQAEARQAFGLPTDRPIALLSFGGLGFSAFDPRGLQSIGEVLFVSTERYSGSPPNLFIIDRPGIDYTTLVRAADVIVTKPGYGITALALAGGVRVLYTSRGDFPEYPILVNALETHGTAQFIAPGRLARCEMAEEVRSLLARPVSPMDVPCDGAERAAERMRAFFKRR